MSVLHRLFRNRNLYVFSLGLAILCIGCLEPKANPRAPQNDTQDPSTNPEPGTSTPVLSTGIDFAFTTPDTIPVGKTVQLFVVVLPPDADDTSLACIGADPTVLLLEGTNATGVARGSTTIICTANDAGGASNELDVTVIVDSDEDGVDDLVDRDADGDGWIDISNLNQLDEIRDNPFALQNSLDGVTESPAGFELIRDLDFQSSASYSDTAKQSIFTAGNGWNPIDLKSNFKGNNYTITGLFINRIDQDYIGLFGSVGSLDIRDIKLKNVQIKGKAKVGSIAGSIAGSNGQASIQNVHTAGQVTGIACCVGGLVGYVQGQISNSSSYAAVTGESKTGGLVGALYEDLSRPSWVKHSFARGPIVGTDDTGGLVGYMSHSSVYDSYALGNVSGETSVGGLIGMIQDGGVEQSFASGNVTGTVGVAGLIGNVSDGTIINAYSTGNAYATGTILGAYDVGGFVGSAGYNVILKNSFTTSHVYLANDGYGLIGRDYYDSVQTYDTYWDTDLSGAVCCSGGRTTSELQAPTSSTGIFGSWDSNIWDFGTSSEYPVLKTTPGGVQTQR